MSDLGGGSLFGQGESEGGGAPWKLSMANAPMGTRLDSIGRYKMPLLPGDSTPQEAMKRPEVERWVSRGLQSMTNLAASISDTKALGDWKLEQALIGVGLHPELAAALRDHVYAGRAAGVNFQALRDHKDFKTGLWTLAEKAFDVGGANAARDAGIAAHDVWESEAKGLNVPSSPLGGSSLFRDEIGALKVLLEKADLEVVPQLVERTVRNSAVAAAGRFDNILRRRSDGRLFMADLKTKRKPFWTWLEMDAQLAGYAYAEHMLAPDGTAYEEGGGPRGYVDLEVGVILHMPSDGAPPRLRKADLVAGWETLQLARRVCTQRSYGRSAGRMVESWW